MSIHEYIEFAVIAIMLLVFIGIFIDRAKDKCTGEAIKFERLRTLLYQSFYLKQPISVLLFKNGGYIDTAVVQTGIVTNIVNGTQGAKWRDRYLGGYFSLGIRDHQGQEILFNISNIYAVSLTTESDPQKFLKGKDTVNGAQHLSPFTGFASCDYSRESEYSRSSESHYYHILSALLRM